MTHSNLAGGTMRSTYFTSVLFTALLMFAATVSPAQTLTTLATFSGSNGAVPIYSSAVQGFDGNFYGTTTEGGLYGYGTVFQVTPDGTLTTLYSFCSLDNCADGSYPQFGVILGTDGNFYGTTTSGGTGGTGGSTYGTVFQMTQPAGGCPSGSNPGNNGWCETVLYSFCSQDPNICTDGAGPTGGLIQGADGNFYGTTGGGGLNDNDYGTVYEIAPSGVLTTLYSFCSQSKCTDGAYPASGVVQGSDGNFYGTTQSGGSSPTNCSGNPELDGCGTVFKLTPGGTETVLYNFCSKKNCEDGHAAFSGLTQASNGDLYGTTEEGGTVSPYDYGTVYRITLAGSFKTLHSFDNNDGSEPLGGVVQGTDGNLYGTTEQGASGIAGGSIFKIGLGGGTLTTLYNFCPSLPCVNGADPWAPLFQGTDGSFYGTTDGAGTGASPEGTVFALSTGLAPFVQLYPTSGVDGASVTILGTNLSGATKVSFDGKKAAFTIVSDSEITTTVPTGAKTGKVSVTTPSGTLKSNVAFQVTP
jgi:uncharacterized repeat protein (TIGR03803 family)